MASTVLSRTPGSAGNRRTWTWSGWIKRSELSNAGQLTLFGANSSAGANDEDSLHFNADNTFRVVFNNAGAGDITTSAVLRDVSAWYHIVVAVDTTQATASDRVKIYINGTQQTSFSPETYPTQNYDCKVNNTVPHQIGYIDDASGGGGSTYFNGLMAHVHFIDGTAYDASAFGETDATTGIWKPKTAPSVTYGTNGFFLKFENSGSMGTDSSGNANNFSVSGNLTQTVDTPSNVFNTLNALSNPSGEWTLSNGNTSCAESGTSIVRHYIASTLAPSSGKWYWEVKIITSGDSDSSQIGITNIDEISGNSDSTDPSSKLSIATGFSRIVSRENGTTTEIDSFYTVPSANDIIRFALDLDNTKLYIGVNGNWWNYNTAETGGDPTSGSGYVTNSTNIIHDAMSVYVRLRTGGVTRSCDFAFNFGNGYFGTVKVTSANSDTAGLGEFEYSVPDGYYSLCTKNINLLEYS